MSALALNIKPFELYFPNSVCFRSCILRVIGIGFAFILLLLSLLLFQFNVSMEPSWIRRFAVWFLSTKPRLGCMRDFYTI